MFKRTCLAVVLASIPVFASAQERPEKIKQELAKIRSQIQENEKRRLEIKKGQDEAKRALQETEREARELLNARGTETSRLQSVEKQIEASRGVFQTIRAKQNEERGRLRESVTELYRTNRQRSALAYTLSSTSFGEMARRTGYLRRLADLNSQRLDELKRLSDEMVREEDALLQLRAERSAAVAKLKSIEKDLSRRAQERAAALKQLEAQRKAEEASLAKLRQSAASLERLLASLMGSEETPSRGVETPREEFSGGGLASMRGRLKFPVRGSIVQKFGKQRHDEFSDVIFVKGLEVSASPGSGVRAVAPGKVVLVQDLPTIGRVVILDHGARYYSLYGRLSEPKVSVGATVDANEILGSVGESDEKGRNFYFEIRVRGKAVDPQSFFGAMPPIKASGPKTGGNGAA